MMKNGRPCTNENSIIDCALIYTLTDNEIAVVSGWIKDNIRPAKTNFTRHTSYALKHLLQQDTDVYLTNNQFKHAMLLAGYVPIDPNVQNWEYRIELTREIIENPSPFFHWLRKYTDDDSMIGDFARDVVADRAFPAMADYWVIRRYLKSICVCDGCMQCFEAAWKHWRNHKRNVKRRERIRAQQNQ